MTREHADVLDRIGERLAPTGDAFERVVRRRASKVFRRRMSAGALGVGVTAALIAGVYVFGASKPEAGSQVIRPANGVPLVAQPGQYYYVRFSTFQVGDGGSIVGTGQSQLWVGTDDSGRVQQTTPDASTDHRYQAGDLPVHILTDLSVSPGEAIQQLIARGAPGGASPNAIATTSPGRSPETTSLLRTLEDLFTFGSDAFLTPTQIQAVFEGSQTISDITTTTGATDPLGRAATRLSFAIDYNDGHPAEVDWYFDPSTGQFMGEVWRDQATGAPQGATMIDVAGIAGSMDAVPTADAQYVPPGSDQPGFDAAHA
jgi:hypothetical protein